MLTFIFTILIALLCFLLITLPGILQFHKLLRQLWREPQRFRSCAWWMAVPFHLLWLPAWYGEMATFSQPNDYNPEIVSFSNFNFTWLLAAVILQTVIAAVLLRQHQHRHPRAFARCAAFVLTGITTVALSYWLAEYLYRPLYHWWWEPLLRTADLGAAATLQGLNHTSYSYHSLLLYVQALAFFILLGGLWCYLLFKLTPAQPLTPTKEDL